MELKAAGPDGRGLFGDERWLGAASFEGELKALLVAVVLSDSSRPCLSEDQLLQTLTLLAWGRRPKPLRILTDLRKR
jgi:hypothetical protein